MQLTLPPGTTDLEKLVYDANFEGLLRWTHTAEPNNRGGCETHTSDGKPINMEWCLCHREVNPHEPPQPAKDISQFYWRRWGWSESRWVDDHGWGCTTCRRKTQDG